MSGAKAEYELSVRYSTPDGIDADIDAIADRFGFALAASGGGFGGRDLHHGRAARPAESEIEEIKAALKALSFPVWAAIEVWVYDEAGDVVQDESGGNEVIDLVDDEAAARMTSRR